LLEDFGLEFLKMEGTEESDSPFGIGVPVDVEPTVKCL
jgi:hypothetical protein